MLINLPYVHHTALTGNIEDDVVNFLCANDKAATAEHSVKVAATCVQLAGKFMLDKTIAYTSGLLHDISSVIKPSDMLEYAQRNSWYIDESETKHNFILHQRISSVIACEYFNVSDDVVLNAIECHSTLKADASDYDMALFLADKISWDQQGIPPYLSIVEESLDTSLTSASLTYINFALENDMILLPHKWLIDAVNWLKAFIVNPLPLDMTIPHSSR